MTHGYSLTGDYNYKSKHGWKQTIDLDNIPEQLRERNKKFHR